MNDPRFQTYLQILKPKIFKNSSSGAISRNLAYLIQLLLPTEVIEDALRVTYKFAYASLIITDQRIYCLRLDFKPETCFVLPKSQIQTTIISDNGIKFICTPTHTQSIYFINPKAPQVSQFKQNQFSSRIEQTQSIPLDISLVKTSLYIGIPALILLALYLIGTLLPPATPSQSLGDPYELCQTLNKQGLPTRSYKDLIGDGSEYGCASNYFEIGFPGSNGLATNLAYYVSGSRTEVFKVKLILNLNNEESASEGLKKLASATSTLFNHLKITPPPDFAQNILQRTQQSFSTPTANVYFDQQISRIYSYELTITTQAP